jgi:class 3 adenylate cyclase/tetratricopeptide (TPR) repeat protein
MKCPGCQAENKADARFCEDCGARLDPACPSCGTPVTPGKNFCRSCGAALIIEPAGRFASPKSYTPTYLAEKILTSKSALEGERKQVTVLFADLKGSMELLADRDPEEARKILDPVLERMMEAVHRYEGMVNQVMGDGIMALFGAPLAHEDHAVRACYAALRMQESVKRYTEDVRRVEGIPIQIRVGLNSGEVVVRSIGSDLHMDYSAIGQTTHLAARMEQMATPGSILVTPATLRLAEGYVRVKPLGFVPVKGLAEPVEVHEVTGAAPIRTRLEVAAVRGLTRFVGRAVEIAQLRLALEHAREGRGQVAAIVGEPGVGKSRLVWELTRRHPPGGWLVLEAGASSYGRATSYLSVSMLLRSYFKLGEHETHEDIGARISARLSALGENSWPALPALAALLGVPVENAQWDGLDPRERRQYTLDVARRLIIRESQIQPLLLILEDLHWIDAETQAWLDSLVDAIPAARLLLLVTYRPEYQHAWGSRTNYTQLRVDPLPRQGAEDLLHALLGGDPELASLRELLIERTEGNPFFLEESVRTLVETRVLVGQRGAYRLAQTLDAVQVPATVQAILASRIDRLPQAEKQLLQAAAVIGKDVPLNLLHAIADEADEDLRRQLAHLQSAEFLYETRLFPEAEYTFKHALTQEVAYGSLLTDHRRAVHARIAEEIERLHPDPLGEHVDRLAHHAFRGEKWEKAVAYLCQAGTTAAARSANREAGVYYEQALAAVAHLPETRETLERSVDLHVARRHALYALGDLELQLRSAGEAESLARRLGDERRIALTSALISASLNLAGRPASQAIAFAERALASGVIDDDVRLYAEVNLQAGSARFYAGDHHGSEGAFRNVLRALEGDLSRERLIGTAHFPAVYARCLLVWSLAARGEFDHAAAYGEEAIGLAETLEHSHGVITSCWALGYLYAVKGELSRAIRWWERGLELARNVRRAVPAVLITGSLCYLYALSGRTEECLGQLDDAIRGHESLRAGGVVHSLIAVHLAEACMFTGRREEARTLVGRALTLTRERGQHAFEACALRLLAELGASDGPLGIDNAEERWREALTIGARLGMRPLVAHCHLGLGKLYRRTGKREQAQEHLTTATTMYREMDMRFWLEQIEKEMGELR